MSEAPSSSPAPKTPAPAALPGASGPPRPTASGPLSWGQRLDQWLRKLDATAQRLHRVLEGPVLVGIALLVGTAIPANQPLNRRLWRTLHPSPPARKWEIGQEHSLALTLISADASRLQCAHNESIGDLHCTHTASRKTWPTEATLDDNGATRIQPYRTADTNQLVLVAGVWAQPELAFRVHREPPSSVKKEDKLPRFTAHCQVRFEGELKGFELRWKSKAPWQKQKQALVGRALSCSLTAPEE